MSKNTFSKYQGASNDFILIDDRVPFFNPQLVPQLCHRKLGIGADGVILLQHDSVADFRMRIFNNDGSEPESCGNGLRCLARFLIELGFPQKSYQIATANRIVEVGFVGDKVSVQMGEPRHVKRLYISGQEVHSLDTGIPHAVLFVPDVSQVDVQKEGAELRHHPAFLPRGTNVNFVTMQPNGVHVRTFERGLEAESLACGTGAAAVAFIAAKKGMANPISIIFPGGVMEAYVEEAVKIVGHAFKVFDGSYSICDINI